MRKSLPTRALREHPDLNQLKRQAKELLAAPEPKLRVLSESTI